VAIVVFAVPITASCRASGTCDMNWWAITKTDLNLALEHQTLRLTVRLGGMVAVAVAILATIIKL
jgi:hypothetical protein